MIHLYKDEVMCFKIMHEDLSWFDDEATYVLEMCHVGNADAHTFNVQGVDCSTSDCDCEGTYTGVVETPDICCVRFCFPDDCDLDIGRWQMKLLDGETERFVENNVFVNS